MVVAVVTARRPLGHHGPQLRRKVVTAGGEGLQLSGAHLVQLQARRHLLRDQGRLDAVEQALQPADQLRLRDPQLRLGGDRR
jgi:hypothetical protein